MWFGHKFWGEIFKISLLNLQDFSLKIAVKLLYVHKKP